MKLVLCCIEEKYEVKRVSLQGPHILLSLVWWKLARTGRPGRAFQGHF